MSQYHRLVNLDKHEYVSARNLGDSVQLVAQAASIGGVTSALAALISVSNGRGGGDFRADDNGEVYGRWAGDRIAFVGDYAENTDLPADLEAGTIYDRCQDADGDRDRIAHLIKLSTESALSGDTESATYYAAKAASIGAGPHYTDISGLVAPVLAYEFGTEFRTTESVWHTPEGTTRTHVSVSRIDAKTADAEDAATATPEDYRARCRTANAAMGRIGIKGDARHQFLYSHTNAQTRSSGRLTARQLARVLAAVDLRAAAAEEVAS